MSTTIDLSNVKFPDPMDLRTAALYLGLGEMRIRTLAREGTLKGAKNDAGQWLFTKANLEAYKTTPRVRKAGGKVSAAGKAWVIHVKPADYEKVIAALKPLGIVLEQRYDYAGQKQYRLKRAADLKAKGLDGHGKPITKVAATPLGGSQMKMPEPFKK